MVIVPVLPDRLLPDVVAIGSFLRGSGSPVERRTAPIGCEHTQTLRPGATLRARM
jgi:hypothetical protein